MGPGRPMLCVLLLDADVLDQIATRHVLANAVPVTDLLEVHGHEPGKFLDRWPYADHEALHGWQRQLGVSHQGKQFVLDDPALVRRRFMNDALQPDRIATDAFQVACATEYVWHDPPKVGIRD